MRAKIETKDSHGRKKPHWSTSLVLRTLPLPSLPPSLLWVHLYSPVFYIVFIIFVLVLMFIFIFWPLGVIQIAENYHHLNSPYYILYYLLAYFLHSSLFHTLTHTHTHSLSNTNAHTHNHTHTQRVHGQNASSVSGEGGGGEARIEFEAPLKDSSSSYAPTIILPKKHVRYHVLISFPFFVFLTTHANPFSLIFRSTFHLFW